MNIAQQLTDLIGTTPLLRLKRVAPDHSILAKLECFNPLSSAKDRAAWYMIRDAEEKGLLQPGGVIVEPTSGNTGVGLSYVAAVRGYRVILTMPETMSQERRSLLSALGAELVLTEGAKADSVPNLEIENGNIEGAGHASATGRFDDQQLFYLRARGIPETEARRLVVLGFFNEIVAEIGVDEVEERLMAAIEKELELTGLITARTDQDPAAQPAAE